MDSLMVGKCSSSEEEEDHEMSMVVCVDPQKTMPAPFLTKTYQLVDDRKTDHIVSWGEDESTFVVWRPPEFARDLLPNYFKHNNFSSFVRQLNTYGFKKIVSDRWEFANEFFKKGKKHLLSEIHRRKTHQTSPQHYFDSSSLLLPHQHSQSFIINPADQNCNNNNNNGWVDHHQYHQSALPVTATSGESEFLSALAEDNNRLRRRNIMLLSELTHMKKLYNDIVYFIQNHVEKTVLPNDQTRRFMITQGPNKFNDHESSNHHFFGGQNFKSNTNCCGSSSCSSVTISHDHKPNNNNNNNNNTVKLFGVPLCEKKRLHQQEKFDNDQESKCGVFM
ncbi:hypothetical protein Syun_031471 [Stephania yunnanensis]|uniref:HSF-type DNA-binding domain-containing protein n=1 Tax=Stephania yunnanensis TaxID=152371 RepID=A0AAP0DZK6_9MAGN